MTARLDVERKVADWLRAAGAARAPLSILPVVLDATVDAPQERHLTQRLFGDELGRSASLRLVIGLALIVLAGVTAVVIGSLLLDRVPPPRERVGVIVVVGDARAADDLGGLPTVPAGSAVRDLYRLGDDGIPHRILNDEVDQVCPALSPDGGTLAYLEPTNLDDEHRAEAWTLVLARLDAAGKLSPESVQPVVLPVVGNVRASCFAWAPDGRSLGRGRPAAAQEVGGVEIVTVTTGETRFVRLERTEAEVTAFAWAPDGGRFAVYAAGGGMDLILISATTGDMALPGDVVRGFPGVPSTIAWSPDGSLLAVDAAFDELSGSQVVRIVPAVDEAAGIVDLDGEAPAWSPDGRRLAFFRSSTPALVVVDRDGGAEQAWTAPLERRLSRLVWAPDGSAVVYVGVRADGLAALIEVRIDGPSEPSLLTPLGGALAVVTDGDLSWQEVKP